MPHDNIYILQLSFTLLSTVFLIAVMVRQLKLYVSTTTDYANVRKIILGLVFLAFVGNFTHLEPGHTWHSAQVLVMSVGWWLLYKYIADELARTNKTEAKLDTQISEQQVEIEKLSK